MKVEWINRKEKDGCVTFSTAGLTLNIIALRAIGECQYAMIGIDKENKRLLIKPISNNHVVRNDIDPNSLYKVSFSRSYGRISSIDLISSIEEGIGIQVIDRKFISKWDEKENVLLVDFKKEVK